jgi:hypothetical protein
MMNTKRRNTLIIIVAVWVAWLALKMLTGCAMVPCNRVFPKLDWYWSADAKACREYDRPQPQPPPQTKWKGNDLYVYEENKWELICEGCSP